MKRLISWGLLVVAAFSAACGSMGPEKSGTDDFETTRDFVTVRSIQSGDVLGPLSGRRGSEQQFSIVVPAGATNLRFVQSGGTGDADLYVRFGESPTTNAFDYRPYTDGNDETVTPSPVKAGTWFAMVRGYGRYAGVTLVISFDAPPTPP